MIRYFALICGVLVGFWSLTRPGVINKIGIYIVFYRYRDKNRYYSYYDYFKQPFALNMIEDQGLVHNYSDYLKIIKKFRPHAYDESIENYEIIAEIVILKYLPFCILTSLIFLFNWYLYLLGMLIAAVFTVIYLFIFEKNIFFGFKNRIYIYTINNYFIKTRWPKESDRPKIIY